MRLLSVGPSPLRSGGVAFYQRALDPEFKKYNIETFYLGVDQVNHALKEAKIESIKSFDEPTFNNVFDLILCSGVYFGGVNPVEQVSESSAERVFFDFLKDNEIDVVHFHAARPASLITVAKLASCRVFVSLHDYWYLCSLGFLVDPNRQKCKGSNGTRCSLVCDSFSRDKEEYIRRNTINFWIRYNIKLFLKILTGKKFDKIRKKLSNTTNHILPSLGAIRSNRPFSEKRSYMLSDWHVRQKSILEIINEAADLVISVSKIVTKRHLSLGINAEKLITLNSGFEHAQDTFFLKSRRLNRPIENEVVNLVFVSPLYPEKGLHIVIAAIKLLINDGFQVKLSVHGKMEQWSSNYWRPLLENLPEQIKFHGSFEYKNLPEIYCKSDIAIVAPIMEDPSPRVVWEALSAGVPVIASKNSGASDFVFHKKNGLLFENSNIEDLYDKLKFICQNQSKIGK